MIHTFLKYYIQKNNFTKLKPKTIKQKTQTKYKNYHTSHIKLYNN